MCTNQKNSDERAEEGVAIDEMSVPNNSRSEFEQEQGVHWSGSVTVISPDPPDYRGTQSSPTPSPRTSHAAPVSPCTVG